MDIDVDEGGESDSGGGDFAGGFPSSGGSSELLDEDDEDEDPADDLLSPPSSDFEADTEPSSGDSVSPASSARSASLGGPVSRPLPLGPEPLGHLGYFKTPDGWGYAERPAEWKHRCSARDRQKAAKGADIAGPSLCLPVKEGENERAALKSTVMGKGRTDSSWCTHALIKDAYTNTYFLSSSISIRRSRVVYLPLFISAVLSNTLR